MGAAGYTNKARQFQPEKWGSRVNTFVRGEASPSPVHGAKCPSVTEQLTIQSHPLNCSGQRPDAYYKWMACPIPALVREGQRGPLSPIPTGNDEIQNRKRQDSKISHPQFLSGKWRTLLSNAGGPATVHKGKCAQNNPENGQTEAGMWHTNVLTRIVAIPSCKPK